MSEFYVRECFYRGYVESNGKASIEKYGDRELPLHSLTEALAMDSFCGIMDDDAVLVDCDSMSEAELVLDLVKEKHIRTMVYRSNHGMHFLFKNTLHKINRNSTHSKKKPKIEIAMGLEHVDIKCGEKNGYECLKKHGKTLTVEYDSGETVNGDLVYDEVPCWLRNIRLTEKYQDVHFLGMSDGDGRNDCFFNYSSCLIGRNRFTHDEYYETMDIINNYVLAVPLDPAEYAKVTREDRLPDEIVPVDGRFYIQKGNNFVFDVVAFCKFLREDVRFVMLNNDLHWYSLDDGTYHRALDSRYELGHICEHYNPYMDTPLYNKIRDKLFRTVDTVIESSPNYIIVKNGIFDVEKKRLYPHTNEIISTSRIPHELIMDESYFDQDTIDFVNKVFMQWCCGRSDLVNFLFEIIGHSFYRKNVFRPIFILTGGGRNGKSTFLKLVTYLLTGETEDVRDTADSKNVSTVTLQELGDRFKRVRLVGAMANIGADIPSTYIEDPSTIKMCASGDRFDVERKGQDSFSYIPYATMIFACNTMPKFNDKTDGINSRMYPIPFDAKFLSDGKKSENETNLEDELLTEKVAEYVVYRAMKSLCDILANGGFHIPEAVANAKREFQMDNDPVSAYFADVTDDTFVGHTSSEMYLAYTDWCNRYGIESHIKQKQFTARVNKEFDLNTTEKTADNKGRIYRRNK